MGFRRSEVQILSPRSASCIRKRPEAALQGLFLWDYCRCLAAHGDLSSRPPSPRGKGESRGRGGGFGGCGNDGEFAPEGLEALELMEGSVGLTPEMGLVALDLAE